MAFSKTRKGKRSNRRAAADSNPDPNPGSNRIEEHVVADDEGADVLERDGGDVDEARIGRALSAMGEGSKDIGSREVRPDLEPAPVAALSPADVVNLLETLISVPLRATVIAKGGTWTDEIERQIAFTERERAKLLATAPYVVPHVSGWLADTKYAGLAFFALAVFDVVTGKLSVLKAAQQKCAIAPTVAPAPAADVAQPGPAPAAAPAANLEQLEPPRAST